LYNFQNKKGALISFYLFVLHSAAGTRGNYLKAVLEISSKAVCKRSSYDYWIQLQGIYIVNKERQHKIAIIKTPGVSKDALNFKLLGITQFLNDKNREEIGVYIISQLPLCFWQAPLTQQQDPVQQILGLCLSHFPFLTVLWLFFQDSILHMYLWAFFFSLM